MQSIFVHHKALPLLNTYNKEIRYTVNSRYIVARLELYISLCIHVDTKIL